LCLVTLPTIELKPGQRQPLPKKSRGRQAAVASRPAPAFKESSWTLISTAPPRRSGVPELLGGWRGLAQPSRVAPRRRRLRALSAQRLRFADTRVIHSFHRDVGSASWTPSNSPNGRPRLSPSLRASLCLRTCAPTAPASSRSYGCRSRGASTCRPGVWGGCRAALSERSRPRLRPYGRWGRRGTERSHRLWPRKGAEAPRRQSGAAGSRTSFTPNNGSNPMSRDLAADAWGKLTTRQALGRR
jgi:hypothetical protein